MKSIKNQKEYLNKNHYQNKNKSFILLQMNMSLKISYDAQCSKRLFKALSHI